MRDGGKDIDFMTPAELDALNRLQFEDDDSGLYLIALGVAALSGAIMGALVMYLLVG